MLVTANLGQYSVRKAETSVVSGSLLANSTIYQPMQVLPGEMYCVKDLLVDYSVFP